MKTQVLLQNKNCAVNPDNKASAKKKRQIVLRSSVNSTLYSEYSTIMLMEKKNSSIYM